jgi:hypothetical protein
MSKIKTANPENQVRYDAAEKYLGLYELGERE